MSSDEVRDDQSADGQVSSQFAQLLEYLKGSRGFDFSAYKPNSLQRRIRRRMQTVGVAEYDQYLDYLEVHPDEFSQLFNTILINVTDFFRDPAAWEVIAQNVLPRILASKEPGDNIRVWSAGSSAGQEAYSIAILLAEALGHERFVQLVKIYATDLDEEALVEARQATYTAGQLESVPPRLRQLYFEPSGERFVFHKDLRRAVIFGRHDLLRDAPISRIDLLICRNTLMYFNSEAQELILSRFGFALNNGGTLFLGKAEVLLTRSTAFTPIDIRHRIFVKTTKGRLAPPVMDSGLARAPGGADGQRLRELALDADPVAQLVIDMSGSLGMINAQARQLLGLTRDNLGQALTELQIYRPIDLGYLMDQAVAERRTLHLKEVEWAVPGGEKRYLDILAIPLVDLDGTALGVKVIFSDVSRSRRLQEELRRTHQEVEAVNEELQAANEELETTNEELQSTVEELETTNEQLQSTNEDLETMNEELQSTNEELETANDELVRRGQDLNGLNNFLEAILSGLNDGVIVVDRDMQVRAWNHRAEDLWGLRAEEARGQHLLSLDIGLPVDQLKPIVRANLTLATEGEVSSKAVVVDAINRRGRPIRLRVAASRLTGPDDSVQGVILVMEEQPPGDGAAA